MLPHERLSVWHQGANEGRRETENRHSFLLDDLPEAVGRGPVGGALREHERRAERVAADHRPGPHDPAHVGHEVDDVSGAGVRLVTDLARDGDEEAPLHVHDSFRTAARPGGVDEQVRGFRVDEQWGEDAFGSVERVVPAEVAACLHRHPVAGEPGPDDDVLDAGRMFQRVIGDLLQRHHPAPSERAVSGHEHLRLRVSQPLRDCRCREAGENGHLDRADVGAGVRDDHGLGRHG